MKRLAQLWRVTTFRLSLIYTLLFGIVAFALVIFVSVNSGRILIAQVKTSAQEEVEELSSIYARWGAGRLIRTIEIRSRAPGAYLYLITDAQGRTIAGNVKSVDPSVFDQVGWNRFPFPYEPLNEEVEGPHRAIAQIFELPRGLRLLVGRDMGGANYFRAIIVQAMILTLAIMVLAGLVLWFAIGRRALQRIDDVSSSSQRIIAGDLSERLPLNGSNDEFDRLSLNLNSLIARIEQLNSGVRTMSDSIAHDLKTPLARLRNNAETALNEGPNEDSVVLQKMVQDADAILRTFDALLMISQVQAGSKTVTLTPTRLDAVVDDITELFEPSFADADANLILVANEEVTVGGSRELLGQVLTNLLDNVLKYGLSHKNPKVELSLTVQSQAAVITISDNGVGISDDDKERVKERFVRLDKSRNKSGSGLGLSLVEAIVSLHNGKLELKDNDPGLRVEVTIPLLEN